MLDYFPTTPKSCIQSAIEIKACNAEIVIGSVSAITTGVSEYAIVDTPQVIASAIAITTE
jgi:hypothetical protein